jgi:hypothetical protein
MSLVSQPFPYSAQPDPLILSDNLGLSENQEPKLRNFARHRVVASGDASV